ncbi:MAG: hypothetical protein ABFE07_29500 [Armatimonadia bacterium]
MPGQVLNIKCYLEGVEVPLSSVSISSGVNAASTASISLPPSRAGFKLRPRTRVHLFWLDDATREWLLLWEGEILGLSSEKEPGSRSLSYACADLSNYWDYTPKMMMSLSTGVQFMSEIMFYGNTSSTVSVGKDLVVDQIWERLAQKSSLPEAIKSFLADLTNDIPYFQTVNGRTKLNEQLRLVDDTHVQELIKATDLTALCQNVSGASGDKATLRQILQAFAGMAGYLLCAPGTPAWTGNSLGSFFLLPNTYGCLPPRCNVVFPDTCSKISYQRNFMAEPTRMWCRGQPIPGADPGKLTAVNCTAPAYLFEAIAKPGGSVSKESIFSSFTDEELERGVRPEILDMPFPQLFSLNPDKKSYNVEYLQQYVDYAFQVARYAGRTLSFSTPLNPWLVAGFPCAVFDSVQSYFAQIDAVNHVVDGSGGGYSHVQCSLAREIDPANDDSPFIAKDWFNANYQPAKIHDTYQALLGCAALGDPSAALIAEKPGGADAVASGSAYKMQGSDRLNTSRVAAGVYSSEDKGTSQYHAAVQANSAYSFADGYRRRPLARMRDVFAFYGVSQPGQYPPEEFDGDLLSYKGAGPQSVNGGTIVTAAKYKRNLVKAYADELRQSRVLDGR